MIQAVEFSNRVDWVMSLYRDICNKRKITKTNTYHHVFSKVQTPAAPSVPPAEESPSESEASEGRVEASSAL